MQCNRWGRGLAPRCKCSVITGGGALSLHSVQRQWIILADEALALEDLTINANSSTK